jgi:hypothetical protein
VTNLAPWILKPRKAHFFKRVENDFYPTTRWVIDRLLDVDIFIGEVIDPCCGSGTIVTACRERHLPTEGWDLVDRGFPGTVVRDFLTYDGPRPANFIFNVPFNLAQPFAERAVSLARHKVAMLFPVRSLNAAHWLRRLPVSRVWHAASLDAAAGLPRRWWQGGGRNDRFRVARLRARSHRRTAPALAPSRRKESVMTDDRIDVDVEAMLSEALRVFREGALRFNPKFYGISIDDVRRALEPARAGFKIILQDLRADSRREGSSDTYDLLVEDEWKEFLGDAAE